jgi:autotransporter translocation and assembly factor TamB
MNVESEYSVPARSGSGMSEATIRMRVERKLERFEFTLSSEPPMEQADILSYLTTGTATSGAFASTSSQGNLATSAALEQVVGAIGGLTQDKIPLDIFQIRQDGSRGITIVAGNYVTPQTYLGVRYPILLQQSGLDSYYDTGTEFEVEYQAVPWLFLNAKGGSTRLMFLLKSRYAY